MSWTRNIGGPGLDSFIKILYTNVNNCKIVTKATLSINLLPKFTSYMTWFITISSTAKKISYQVKRYLLV